MKYKCLLLFFIVCISLVANGCGTTTRMYTGPVRDKSNVVVIQKHHYKVGLTINGTIATTAYTEVLPGPVTLRMSTFKSQRTNAAFGAYIMGGNGEITFEAKAGHKYIVGLAGQDEFVVVDKNSGRVVTSTVVKWNYR